MIGVFSSEFKVAGLPGRKYGKVIYANDSFYQWAVQDIPGYSSQNAKAVFDAYVKYFELN